jgi:SAM-dependent methyltransferase
MTERSPFAGGDQRYLRDEQYGDSSRLRRRAGLHERYSTAAVPWFDWVSARLDLAAGHDVLEVGCGPGALWTAAAMAPPLGVSLLLTDLSAGMVGEAVDRVRGSGRLARVSGAVADAQALPLRSRSFGRVVANHMLYHLPEPGRGVAELGRVVAADGAVIVATNGRRHMAELRALQRAVFDGPGPEETIAVFGVDSGFPLLRDHFADVRWLAYPDVLRCSDPTDVLAYATSTPPGEDATAAQREQLRAAIDAAFEAGGGVMAITKDTGCFVCRGPLARIAPGGRESL